MVKSKFFLTTFVVIAVSAVSISVSAGTSRSASGRNVFGAHSYGGNVGSNAHGNTNIGRMASNSKNLVSHNPNAGTKSYTRGPITVTTNTTASSGYSAHSVTISNSNTGNSLSHQGNSEKVGEISSGGTVAHGRGTTAIVNTTHNPAVVGTGMYDTAKITNIGLVNLPGTPEEGGGYSTGIVHQRTVGTPTYSNQERTAILTAPNKEIVHTGVTPNNPTGGTVIKPLP